MPRGSRRLPDECLGVLGRSDLILHAGDFVTAAVLDELAQLAPVSGVHGNMDDAVLKAMLPERRVVEAAGLRIGMVHEPGPRTARAERLLGSFPDCDVVVYGHTHLPEVARYGARWVVNPGSPTERRSAPARSMAILGGRRPRLLELA